MATILAEIILFALWTVTIFTCSTKKSTNQKTKSTPVILVPAEQIPIPNSREKASRVLKLVEKDGKPSAASPDEPRSAKEKKKSSEKPIKVKDEKSLTPEETQKTTKSVRKVTSMEPQQDEPQEVRCENEVSPRDESSNRILHFSRKKPLKPTVSPAVNSTQEEQPPDEHVDNTQ